MNKKTNLETLILAVLSAESLHGYEIAKAIRAKSENLLKPSEGQLYPALHKLEAEGHISAEWVVQEGKPNRKTYTITESGSAKLATNKQSWEKYIAGVGSVLSIKCEAEGSHA
jgi:PadR family transcriptional regulator, regulatory protein PadR